MKKRRNIAGLIALIALFMVSTRIFSQDPNFYIYLCFGQSNMEGQGTIEPQDQTVDPRLQVMEAVECSNLGRTKGTWYNAIPPLCRCYSGLSPADYFGRTMVANLPDSIKVGIVNVSVAGCKIELYDKDTYQDYISTITESWLIDIINAYDGNPYGYLVEVAQMAQQDGVIKGILLHQGESNTGDTQWPSKVRKIYNDLINDLGLDADSVPLLAGEVVNADQGGVCAAMNSIIAILPDTLPNSYVIPSSGCTDAADNLHFNSEGYRELGRRYAVQMLTLLNYETIYGRGAESDFLEPECATVGANWLISADDAASNGSYVTIKPGVESILEAPADSANVIYIPFTIENAGYFSIFARLSCTGANNDSYWVKIDDGPFEMLDGLRTAGWQWMKLSATEMAAGEHTVAVGCREDGAKLDKINITDFLFGPSGAGKAAENICEPPITNSLIDVTIDGYALSQNRPNPVNKTTRIAFEIPGPAYVSLKVYDMTGTEITELAGSMYQAGEHVAEFNCGNLPAGYYYYILTAGEFVATRRMTILAE